MAIDKTQSFVATEMSLIMPESSSQFPSGDGDCLQLQNCDGLLGLT